MKPVGKHIIVRPDKPENRYKGNFLRPCMDMPTTGEVIEVSPDYEFKIKKGDRIKYYPNHQEVMDDGTIVIRADSEGAVILIL